MLALVAASLAVPAPTTFPFECKWGFDCLKQPSAMCESDSDCATGLTCVIENDSYSKCVDCTPSTFAKQCIYASETFLPKAMDKCGIAHCGNRCPHHVDGDCVAPMRCAVQADGYYGECVDCDAHTFPKQCQSWSPKIVEAAEKMCEEKCPTVEVEEVDGGACCGVSCTSTSDCAAGLFCCPNHNECMDDTTKSTAGPNCDACSGGGYSTYSGGGYSTYSTYAGEDAKPKPKPALLGQGAHGQAPKKCDDA